MGVPLSRDKVFGIIFDFPGLCLISRLNDERYCEARMRRKLSLLVEEVVRLACFDIDIVAKWSI